MADKLCDEVTEVNVTVKLKRSRIQEFCPRTDPDKSTGTSKNQETHGALEQKLLYINDCFRISDKAMHKMHMLVPATPRKNIIQEARRHLNTTCQSIAHFQFRKGQ